MDSDLKIKIQIWIRYRRIQDFTISIRNRTLRISYFLADFRVACESNLNLDTYKPSKYFIFGMITWSPTYIRFIISSSRIL